MLDFGVYGSYRDESVDCLYDAFCVRRFSNHYLTGIQTTFNNQEYVTEQKAK
jgi:hypothetical protein